MVMKLSGLIRAIENSDLGIVERLLRNKCDLNIVLASGMTPVHLAAGSESCKVEILQLLLELGASPNMRSTCGGFSPLHFAIFANRPDRVKLLLDYRADPNVVDFEGLTPTERALSLECTMCLEVLQKQTKSCFPEQCGFLFKGAFEAAKKDDQILSEMCRLSIGSRRSDRTTNIETPTVLSQFVSVSDLCPLSQIDSLQTTVQYLIDEFGSNLCHGDGFSVKDNSEDPKFEAIQEQKRIDGCALRTSGFCEEGLGPKKTTLSLNETCDFSFDVLTPIECSGESLSINKLYVDPDGVFSLLDCSFPPTHKLTSDNSSNLSIYVPVFDKSIACNLLADSTIETDSSLGMSRLSTNSSDYHTCPSDWKDYKSNSDTPETVDPVLFTISNSELRKRLESLGEHPGPMTNITRLLYIKKLSKLEGHLAPKRPQDLCTAKLDFLPDLRSCLNGTPIPDMHELDRKIVDEFDQPHMNWREGCAKTSFNYFLLDPRVTRELSQLRIKPNEAFSLFTRAIFYVGKGKKLRPFEHFKEALLCRGRVGKNDKVRHILDIWDAGLGVVSLHCFQNMIPVEAFSREAFMIEALGLHRLTNSKRGDYYGLSCGLSLKEKRHMGIYLLFRAMQIFYAEGERQIKPSDIRR